MTILLSFNFFSCNEEKKKVEITPKNPLLNATIKEQLLLDSTRIGRTTIISGLEVPWEILWGPDNWIWFTEQGGKVSKVNPETGEKRLLVEIQEVFKKRTPGLLGMVVHPQFDRFPYVFLNYTQKREDSIISKLVRYTYSNEVLVRPKVLLEIPGSVSHNGSRLTIAPDGKIMWATGDIGPNTDNAQNLKSLNGKILRLNIDGSIPKDNPFSGSPIWLWGQRNVQGMVYGPHNNLYTSEHGDATDDEINLMSRQGNYGWPNVAGFCDTPKENLFCQDSTVVLPLRAWTPTIAPAGIDYYSSVKIPEWSNSLLLTTLKENDLRVLKLNEKGDSILSEKIFFDRHLGRLRDLCISPSGDVYVSTSNRDWNPSEGFPVKEDDRIIKIFKLNAKEGVLDSSVIVEQSSIQEEIPTNVVSKGKINYIKYCASCHKPNGEGVNNTFPSLKGSSWVMGNKEKLIELVLYGVTPSMKKQQGSIYEQMMPGFKFLSNEDMAATLSYIRKQLGDKGDIITIHEVNKVRSKRSDEN